MSAKQNEQKDRNYTSFSLIELHVKHESSQFRTHKNASRA